MLKLLFIPISYVYLQHNNTIMKDSALSIANYLIDKAHENGDSITPLRLMKLVYIAHGFMLAIFNKSVLNPRFDKVEAWKYGPVIPSVYHSFKSYGNQPIGKKTIVFTDEDENGETANFVEPSLADKDAIKVCDFVYNRYKGYTAQQLVSMLHKKESPWGMIYQEGKNNEIPDFYTQVYFKKILESMIRCAVGGKS